MDLMDQLQTPQGRFPVKQAICSLEGRSSQACIKFSFDDSGVAQATTGQPKRTNCVNSV